MSSLAYNFSSGAIFGIRNDSSAPAVPEPVKFGVLQEGSIEFQGTNKELFGQSQFPVDVARGPIKVMGKAKYAQIFSQQFDMFFGQGVTAATALNFALNEAGTVPAPSGPYTVTVSHSATFTTDWGVNYSATGIPLTKVASGPTAGQYSVSAGVYTFAAADTGLVMQISYEYTGTTGTELVITNQLMGTSPTFALVLACTYKGNVANIHLNQCISEKLAFPFKNTDYTILEFDFQAYCDGGGNLGKITLSQ